MRKVFTVLTITVCSVSISYGSIFAATVIDSSTQFDLRTVSTLGAFVCGVVIPAIIWLTRKLQKIEDTLEAMQKTLAQKPCFKEGNGCVENFK